MIYTNKLIELYQKANLDPLFTHSNRISEYCSGDEASGLHIVFQIKWEDKCASECRYKVLGCGYAIGLCVWLEAYLLGKTKSEFSEIELTDLIESFDLPKTKYKVAIAILNIYQQILAPDA